MGMFTELSFAAEVDANTARVLQEFVDSDGGSLSAGFFAKPRALQLLTGWSAYSCGSGSPLTVADDWGVTRQISLRTSFKNYDDEIAAFMHFITPHVIYGVGDMDFVGYHIGDEDLAPTLHFIRGGRHVAHIPATATPMAALLKEN